MPVRGRARQSGKAVYDAGGAGFQPVNLNVDLDRRADDERNAVDEQAAPMLALSAASTHGWDAVDDRERGRRAGGADARPVALGTQCGARAEPNGKPSMSGCSDFRPVDLDLAKHCGDPPM